MKEIWKDVKGYEGYYKVSNKGRIKSLDRTVTDINGREIHYEGQLLSIQLDEFGREKVRLMKDHEGENYKIHRLVAQAFIPNTDNLPCINHIDGNKRNNTVTNLEWCTYSYNNQHAYDTGLKEPYDRDGERNPKAKFSNKEVRHIRNIHKDNGGPYGTMYLARKYNVCKETITNMIKRRTYKNC